MKTHATPKSIAMHAAIRQWVERQCEPFTAAELGGRFNLSARSARHQLRRLTALGVVALAAKDDGQGFWVRA